MLKIFLLFVRFRSSFFFFFFKYVGYGVKWEENGGGEIECGFMCGVVWVCGWSVVGIEVEWLLIDVVLLWNWF